MKKITFALLLALFSGQFLLLHPRVQAQEAETNGKQGFGFRAAGINLAWYKPSMNYWNDTYFADPAHTWENNFNGSILYTGYLELNLVRNLRAKISGAYYNESVKSGEIPVGEVTGTAQLTTSLTFFSLDVIYRFSMLSFAKIYPYAGAGGSLVLVKNTMINSPADNPEESSTEHGQDVTGTITAGLERNFGKHFGAALDFRYIIGNYTQEMKDASDNVTSHTVSLGGPQIGISLFYFLR